MKKIISLVLSVILTLSVVNILPLSALAAELTTVKMGDNIVGTYDKTTKTLTVEGSGEMYAGKGIKEKNGFGFPKETKNLIIKGNIKNISEFAFAYLKHIESVKIPDSVKSIGDFAFYQCEALKSVEFGIGLESIGDSAFSEAELTKLDLPKSLKSIGEDSFWSCSISEVNIGECEADLKEFIKYNSFAKYTLSENNKAYSLQDGVLFNKNKTTLFCYPGKHNNNKTYIVPNSVKIIGDYAFQATFSLDCVVLPDTVEKISEGAFEDSHIKSLSLPKSLTYIGPYAFNRCGSLLSISLPNTVTTVGEGAFNSCENLESVDIGLCEAPNLEKAFDECYEIEEFIVQPNNKKYSVKSDVLFNKDKTTLVKYPIGKSTKTYTIPQTVTAIGTSAFSSARNLTKVVCSTALKKINSDAFMYSALKEIKFNSKLTYIGRCAFIDCVYLKSIKLPLKLKTIEEFAFYNTGIKTIDLPKSLKTIGECAFSSCDIKTVNIGLCETKSNLSDAFYNNRSLEKFTVSSKNKYYSAKSGVLFNKKKTKLIKYPENKASKSYTVPKTVNTIGKYAFHSTNKLKSLKLSSKLKTIGERAFNETSLSKLTVPASVSKIYSDAFCKTKGSIKVYLQDTKTPPKFNKNSYITKPNEKFYVKNKTVAKKLAKYFNNQDKKPGIYYKSGSKYKGYKY